MYASHRFHYSLVHQLAVAQIEPPPVPRLEALRRAFKQIALH